MININFSRYGFPIIIGCSVVMISFVYGLVQGLKNPAEAAFMNNMNIQGSVSKVFTALAPEGVDLTPVGRDIRVNGRDSEICSFESERDGELLGLEVKKKWEGLGLKLMEKIGKSRSLIIGFTPDKSKRYIYTSWFVPPQMRELGQSAVQGFIAGGSSKIQNEDEATGIIPGVPLPPSGKAGSLFTSNDPNGRTFTGSYSSDLRISELTAYYKDELENQGLNLIADNSGENFASLIFSKNGEDTVLLFSEEKDGSKSVVTATKGIKGMSQKQY